MHKSAMIDGEVSGHYITTANALLFVGLVGVTVGSISWITGPWPIIESLSMVGTGFFLACMSIWLRRL